MATKDLIPSGDAEFDALQDSIVSKATLNRLAWGIPDAELTKLTIKQAVWVPAWNAVRIRKNASQAQREGKDESRTAYEKVLRPFIQKWLYRNESVSGMDLESMGLKPRDTTPTDKLKPATPDVVKVTRGETGELFAECDAVAGAEFYGCIICAQPLPSNITLNALGQLAIVASPDVPGGPSLPAGALQLGIDFNKQRRKKFAALIEGQVYYFYFYAVNSAGVSGLSIVVSKKSW